MGQLIDINTRRVSTRARHEPELDDEYFDACVSGPGDLQRFIGDIRSRADLERLQERRAAYEYWAERVNHEDVFGDRGWWPAPQLDDISASAIRRIILLEGAPEIGHEELIMALKLPVEWITFLPVDDRCSDLTGEEGVRSCAVPMPAYKNLPRYLLCDEEAESQRKVWRVYDVLAEPPNTWPRCIVMGFDDESCQRLVQRSEYLSLYTPPC